MTHTLHLGDCREVLPTLPDNSVDLILTDPPYFRVKSEDWDRQWDKPEKFLDWLDGIAAEWQRILRPNGSLYCFASPRMAARVEVLLSRRFEVLNRIRWMKEAGWHQKAEKESLRSYLSPWEEIIFAEHFGADNIAKGEAGYVAKCDELRGFVFEPLRAYLDGERIAAGLTPDEVNVVCGFREKGGMAGRHWFNASQFAMPTERSYLRAREATGRFLREYEGLRREYEDLRREYEDLRRPFSVTADVPYTDVWTFKTVAGYPGKHPCEKPQELLRHVITASSRPGAVVLDCFAGSGSTGIAALALGREFIGVEKCPTWHEKASERLAEAEQGDAQMKITEAA